MRQFHTNLVVAPLSGLGSLSIGQIDNEGDDAVPLFTERCASDQHRHATAVFPKVLLLVRLRGPDRRHFSQSLCVPVMPFWRRQRCSAQSTSRDFRLIVSDNIVKRLIGLLNLPVEVRDQNPNNIRVDKASDLRLPFLKISIKARLFERDRCLRRQEFQDSDSGRRECLRGQGVFEEKNPGQFPLFDQWQAEDRLRLPVAQVVVRREEVAFGGAARESSYPRLYCRPTGWSPGRLRWTAGLCRTAS